MVAFNISMLETSNGEHLFLHHTLQMVSIFPTLDTQNGDHFNSYARPFKGPAFIPTLDTSNGDNLYLCYTFKMVSIYSLIQYLIF